ncbi:MAG: hypothetical protein ACRD21_24025 [Vicinamibacteria bacterium]
MKKNWLEWMVFAVSLALVLGMLGYLAYDAATSGNNPPNIEVRLGAPERGPHHFVIPVSVINHGDQAAKGVLIEVLLETNGRAEESARLDVAFLARGAHRQGWVAFERDPRTAEGVKARVLGYEKP